MSKKQSTEQKIKRAVKKHVKKQAKKHPKLVVALVIILVVILVALAVTYYLKPEIFEPFLPVPTQPNTPSGDHNDTDKPATDGDVKEIKSADLSIHFLELGNRNTGDCTFIKCGDTEVLIDAGSKVGSAAYLSDYIEEYCVDGVLEYVIATHAHEDHIAGMIGEGTNKLNMTGFFYQNYFQVGTIIQFAMTRKTESASLYNKYLTALNYAQGLGTNVYTAAECVKGENGAQSVYYLNDAKTVWLTILDSYYYYNYDNSSENKTDENNYSVCTLLSHKLDDKTTKHYLFTGDLEKDGEAKLVELNNLPQVEVFKGGHHGSKTSNTTTLLEVIRPKNMAICTCCGSSEFKAAAANTFPTQQTVDNIAPYTDAVYCTTLMNDYSKSDYTSMNGNIIFYTIEKTVKLYCSNNTTKLKDTEWFKANRTFPSAWQTA